MTLEGEALAAYLDKACADDTALRATVVAMLRDGVTADSFLEPGAALRGPLAEDLAAAPGAATGDRVGPFRLLHELGRGGMGVVFLAERADGHFEQKVALKLLPADGSSALARRLEAERRILATLKHPGIARLLDGGITHDGAPYFAMEHVEGRPIDVYCDEEEIDVEARLGLLCSVCEAVQSAHQQLVVHRDLKPSNVLVTAAGDVKLLDFGIARLLSDISHPTATVVLTFPYASPEQFRGEAITVATDVYQLGVVLYELLTGYRPFDDAGESLSERLQTTLDRETTPPSVKLRELEHFSQARRVAGDLDHIVLKALARAPAERYASADRLREDIERHLGGWPVRARRGGTVYRLGKLVRRHAVAIGTAAVVTLFVAALVTFYTLSLADERDRARAALHVAERERAAAQLARDESEEVVAFLGEVFAFSDPQKTQGEQLTARELLDRGAARIESEIVDRPRIQARMMTIIGRVYQRLGLYEDAESLLTASLERHEAIADPDPGDFVETLIAYGHLQILQGRYVESETTFRRALANPAVGEERTSALAGLASTVRHLGRFDEAVELFTEVLLLKGEQRGAGDPSLAIDINSLATAIGNQRRYDEAERLHRQALKLLEGSGDLHKLSLVLSNLGLLLAEQRRQEEAEPLLRRATELQERILGNDHPKVALAWGNLAALLVDLGRLDEAAELFSRALDVLETKDPRDRALPLLLNNFANLLLEQKDYEGARQRYEKVLAMQERRLGKDHPDLAFTLNNLGEALLALDRAGVARPHLERSAAIFETVVGRDGLLVSWPVFNLGKVHRALGHEAQAEKLYRRALAIREKELAADAEEIVEVRSELEEIAELAEEK